MHRGPSGVGRVVPQAWFYFGQPDIDGEAGGRNPKFNGVKPSGDHGFKGKREGIFEEWSSPFWRDNDEDHIGRIPHLKEEVENDCPMNTEDEKRNIFGALFGHGVLKGKGV